jgi:hypothetical protein
MRRLPIRLQTKPDAHEVGKIAGFQLVNHIGAMDIDVALRTIEFEGDGLVRFSGGDQFEHSRSRGEFGHPLQRGAILYCFLSIDSIDIVIKVSLSRYINVH